MSNKGSAIELNINNRWMQKGWIVVAFAWLLYISIRFLINIEYGNSFLNICFTKFPR